MFAYLFDMLRDPNAQWILLGSMLLGLSSGVLGSFAYLRKQSLMGDALAHAALPGVCIAFMLTGSKSIFFFLIGAAAAGLIATFGIGYVTRHSRIKQDSALGIVLSVFFWRRDRALNENSTRRERQSERARQVFCSGRRLRWCSPMLLRWR